MQTKTTPPCYEDCKYVKFNDGTDSCTRDNCKPCYRNRNDDNVVYDCDAYHGWSADWHAHNGE